MTRRVLLLLWPLLVAGCFGGSPAPRFFRPEDPDLLEVEAPRRAEGVPVRLHTVGGDAFLSDRIVWRASDVEVGLYEAERWTEPPPTYVRQALGRELYERRGLVRGGRLASYVLQVELRAFEELLTPKHLVRVGVWLLLTDREGQALREETIVREATVKAEEAAAMARAMGAALNAAAAAVADAVTETVAATPREEGSD